MRCGDADVIITMVPDSPDVEAVTGGDDGVFANARKGALYIDMSSIRPDVSVRVAAAGQEAGLRVLDAPVSGGEVGAIEASLSIMVGGEAEDFAAARPVLDAVGKTVVHVGPGGIGTDRQGGQPAHRRGQHRARSPRRSSSSRPTASTRRPRWRCSAAGWPGARCSTARVRGCSRASSQPGFRLALHHKDLGIVQSAAREAGVAIPLGAVVSQLVAAMVARGDGGLDHSGLLKLVLELSGRDMSQ